MFITSSSLITIPKNIVCLVPSITELLYFLGLNEEVKGITKFCIHPTKWHREKCIVGGTKNVNIDKIRALQPELIIAAKEENVADQVNELSIEFNVLLCDVYNFETALEMIIEVGKITGKNELALKLNNEIVHGFKQPSPPKNKLEVTYFIWKDPYMTVGGDTFISNMLEKAGFSNCYKSNKRYPEIDFKDLIEAPPSIIFLSSEPYPFKEKHIQQLQILLPKSIIILVDGELFSWYGSRMLLMPQYFLKLQNSIYKMVI